MLQTLCTKQACSVNFRPGKQILKKHGDDTDSKRAKGRLWETVKSKARNNLQNLISLGRCRSIVGNWGTPLQCCVHERNTLVNHDCE